MRRLANIGRYADYENMYDAETPGFRYLCNDACGRDHEDDWLSTPNVEFADENELVCEECGITDEQIEKEKEKRWASRFSY